MSKAWAKGWSYGDPYCFLDFKVKNTLSLREIKELFDSAAQKIKIQMLEEYKAEISPERVLFHREGHSEKGDYTNWCAYYILYEISDRWY